MSQPPPEDLARAMLDRATKHLPARAERWVQWSLSRWPGRVVTSTTTTFIRVEIFDRSMTIAAQFFTSVFPILIMFAAFFDANGQEIADTTHLPDETASVIDEALTSSSSAAFGVIGALIVLASATSLSRALTRAYAAIWQLPRPRSKLTSAWRWLAVVLGLALTFLVTVTLARRLSEAPPPGFWPIVLTFCVDLCVGLFVPWLLLNGQLSLRLLAPGALLFAGVMLIVRPASRIYLSLALDTSADRFGSIGVAFTYLAFLYVLGFCWLTTAVIGQVVAMDEGSLGVWIRSTREKQPGIVDQTPSESLGTEP